MLRRVCVGLVALLALAFAPSAFATTFTVSRIRTRPPWTGRSGRRFSTGNTQPGRRHDRVQPRVLELGDHADSLAAHDHRAGDDRRDDARSTPGIDGQGSAAFLPPALGLKFAIPVGRAVEDSWAHDHQLHHRARPRQSDSILAVGNYIGTDSEGPPGRQRHRHHRPGGSADRRHHRGRAERDLGQRDRHRRHRRTRALIEGNYIGPTPTERASWAAAAPASLSAAARARSIGGTTPGSRNVISGLIRMRSPSAARRTSSSRGT